MSQNQRTSDSSGPADPAAFVGTEQGGKHQFALHRQLCTTQAVQHERISHRTDEKRGTPLETNAALVQGWEAYAHGIGRADVRLKTGKRVESTHRNPGQDSTEKWVERE